MITRPKASNSVSGLTDLEVSKMVSGLPGLPPGIRFALDRAVKSSIPYGTAGNPVVGLPPPEGYDWIVVKQTTVKEPDK